MAHRFISICGSARTSVHNKWLVATRRTPDVKLIIRSFLEGPKAALVASKDFDNGHYKTQPYIGIRAFGRVYSAWAYGQAVSSCS